MTAAPIGDRLSRTICREVLDLTRLTRRSIGEISAEEPSGLVVTIKPDLVEHPPALDHRASGELSKVESIKSEPITEFSKKKETADELELGTSKTSNNNMCDIIAEKKNGQVTCFKVKSCITSRFIT